MESKRVSRMHTDVCDRSDKLESKGVQLTRVHERSCTLEQFLRTRASTPACTLGAVPLGSHARNPKQSKRAGTPGYKSDEATEAISCVRNRVNVHCERVRSSRNSEVREDMIIEQACEVRAARTLRPPRRGCQTALAEGSDPGTGGARDSCVHACVLGERAGVHQAMQTFARQEEMSETGRAD
eukprot:57868-Pleurochrysis_carterae.AAC.1